MFKYLKIALGFLFIVGGLGLGILGISTVFDTACYRAQAKIIVFHRSQDESYNEDHLDDAWRFVPEQFPIILSDKVLQKSAEKLNVIQAQSQTNSDNPTPKTPWNSKILKKHLSLSPISNTRLIEIEYSDANPKIAADAANMVGEAFQENRAAALEEAYKNNLKTNNIAQVRFTDPAVAPESPMPLKRIGVVIICFGSLPLICGWYILKSTLRTRK